jgi:xanthine dehydrogenase YagS FAD-binding subunit
MNRFSVARPQTIAQAAVAMSNTVASAMSVPVSADQGDTAIAKAGGIDLLDLLKEGLLRPAKLVNLGDVPGLSEVAEEKDGGLRIGPVVTLAALAAHRLVRERYPALAEALSGAASPQIRNVATLGGNLLQRPRCWYFRSNAYHCLRKGGGHCFAVAGANQYHAIFNNMACAIVHPSTAATVLVALGASIEITTAADAARLLSLENFFVAPERDLQRENDLQPHEIVTAIRLPKLPASLHMAHLKQAEKESFDWPLADVAVALDLGAGGACTRAAIILGGAAAVPYRAKAAEAVLTGKRIDEKLAADAAHAALDGATPLADNGYKLPLFETLIRRALLKAVAGATAKSAS